MPLFINFNSNAAPPSPMKFTAPIVVPDSQPPPPQPSYLPPTGTHFLPTILPETSSQNPVVDLLAFPPHINSSYLPTELHAIKDSIDNNHHSHVETEDSVKSLFNFPPNVDSSYLPPGMMEDKQPIDSYLPPPSGDESEESNDDGTTPYTPSKDLHNFPPNIQSSYLPPEMISNQVSNSYIPPPSGDYDDVTSPPDDDSSSYVPPKDLHNFPPNVESSYLPPGMMRNNNPVNSYLPPPSGDQSEEAPPANDIAMSYLPPKNLYNFPPNINANYLPPSMRRPEVPDNSYHAPASGSESDSPKTLYNYNPPSDRFPPNIQSSYLPPAMRQPMAYGNSYLPPPSGTVNGFYDGSKPNLAGPPMQMAPAPMPMQMQMAPAPMPMQMAPAPMPMQMPSGMDSMQGGMGMDSMPSGPMMDMQAPSMDDHHHHHHDHPKWYGGDIIYDFDPHDHHHHHHVEETTTAAPATTEEAPEEPRVKKYSYYYLGRKLWYVPLYFTLWFCLYVALLIIRSIGRHKVN